VTEIDRFSTVRITCFSLHPWNICLQSYARLKTITVAKTTSIYVMCTFRSWKSTDSFGFGCRDASGHSDNFGCMTVFDMHSVDETLSLLNRAKHEYKVILKKLGP
jgi:hypothetical protein